MKSRNAILAVILVLLATGCGGVTANPTAEPDAESVPDVTPDSPVVAPEDPLPWPERLTTAEPGASPEPDVTPDSPAVVPEDPLPRPERLTTAEPGAGLEPDVTPDSPVVVPEDPLPWPERLTTEEPGAGLEPDVAPDAPAVVPEDPLPRPERPTTAEPGAGPEPDVTPDSPAVVPEDPVAVAGAAANPTAEPGSGPEPGVAPDSSAVVDPNDSVAVCRATTTSHDIHDGTTTVTGPLFVQKSGLREGHTYQLVQRSSGPVARQVLVASAVSDDWMFLDRTYAYGERLSVTEPPYRRVEDCTISGCLVIELIAINLSMEELREFASRPSFDFKVSGDWGNIVMSVPGTYFRGFLRALDAREQYSLPDEQAQNNPQVSQGDLCSLR